MGLEVATCSYVAILIQGKFKLLKLGSVYHTWENFGGGKIGEFGES